MNLHYDDSNSESDSDEELGSIGISISRRALVMQRLVSELLNDERDYNANRRHYSLFYSPLEAIKEELTPCSSTQHLENNLAIIKSQLENHNQTLSKLTKSFHNMKYAEEYNLQNNSSLLSPFTATNIRRDASTARTQSSFNDSNASNNDVYEADGYDDFDSEEETTNNNKRKCIEECMSAHSTPEHTNRHSIRLSTISNCDSLKENNRNMMNTNNDSIEAADAVHSYCADTFYNITQTTDHFYEKYNNLKTQNQVQSTSTGNCSNLKRCDSRLVIVPVPHSFQDVYSNSNQNNEDDNVSKLSNNNEEGADEILTPNHSSSSSAYKYKYQVLTSSYHSSENNDTDVETETACQNTSPYSACSSQHNQQVLSNSNRNTKDITLSNSSNTHESSDYEILTPHESNSGSGKHKHRVPSSGNSRYFGSENHDTNEERDTVCNTERSLQLSSDTPFNSGRSLQLSNKNLRQNSECSSEHNQEVLANSSRNAPEDIFLKLSITNESDKSEISTPHAAISGSRYKHKYWKSKSDNSTYIGSANNDTNIESDIPFNTGRSLQLPTKKISQYSECSSEHNQRLLLNSSRNTWNDKFSKFSITNDSDQSEIPTTHEAISGSRYKHKYRLSKSDRSTYIGSANNDTNVKNDTLFNTGSSLQLSNRNTSQCSECNSENNQKVFSNSSRNTPDDTFSKLSIANESDKSEISTPHEANGGSRYKHKYRLSKSGNSTYIGSENNDTNVESDTQFYTGRSLQLSNKNTSQCSECNSENNLEVLSNSSRNTPDDNFSKLSISNESEKSELSTPHEAISGSRYKFKYRLSTSDNSTYIGSENNDTNVENDTAFNTGRSLQLSNRNTSQFSECNSENNQKVLSNSSRNSPDDKSSKLSITNESDKSELPTPHEAISGSRYKLKYRLSTSDNSTYIGSESNVTNEECATPFNSGRMLQLSNKNASQCSECNSGNHQKVHSNSSRNAPDDKSSKLSITNESDKSEILAPYEANSGSRYKLKYRLSTSENSGSESIVTNEECATPFNSGRSLQLSNKNASQFSECNSENYQKVHSNSSRNTPDDKSSKLSITNESDKSEILTPHEANSGSKYKHKSKLDNSTHIGSENNASDIENYTAIYTGGRLEISNQNITQYSKCNSQLNEDVHSNLSRNSKEDTCLKSSNIHVLGDIEKHEKNSGSRYIHDYQLSKSGNSSHFGSENHDTEVESAFNTGRSLQISNTINNVDSNQHDQEIYSKLSITHVSGDEKLTTQETNDSLEYKHNYQEIDSEYSNLINVEIESAFIVGRYQDIIDQSHDSECSSKSNQKVLTNSSRNNSKSSNTHQESAVYKILTPHEPNSDSSCQHQVSNSKKSIYVAFENNETVVENGTALNTGRSQNISDIKSNHNSKCNSQASQENSNLIVKHNLNIPRKRKKWEIFSRQMEDCPSSKSSGVLGEGVSSAEGVSKQESIRSLLRIASGDQNQDDKATKLNTTKINDTLFDRRQSQNNVTSSNSQKTTLHRYKDNYSSNTSKLLQQNMTNEENNGNYTKRSGINSANSSNITSSTYSDNTFYRVNEDSQDNLSRGNSATIFVIAKNAGARNDTNCETPERVASPNVYNINDKVSPDILNSLPSINTTDDVQTQILDSAKHINCYNCGHSFNISENDNETEMDVFQRQILALESEGYEKEHNYLTVSSRNNKSNATRSGCFPNCTKLNNFFCFLFKSNNSSS